MEVRRIDYGEALYALISAVENGEGVFVRPGYTVAVRKIVDGVVVSYVDGVNARTYVLTVDGGFVLSTTPIPRLYVRCEPFGEDAVYRSLLEAFMRGAAVKLSDGSILVKEARLKWCGEDVLCCEPHRAP